MMLYKRNKIMLIVLDYISKNLKLKPLNGFRGLFTIRDIRNRSRYI
jgi:hypothetical protein